jgi:SWI/SNF-related matrix-associated actin-dependent regulator of chromatin subfamily A-like protein 1
VGIPAHAYCGSFVFSASFSRGEAMLRFPYDEGLRQLLRAIPGRRWDSVERAWCLPLGPEQAEALNRILERLPGEPEVEEDLARAIRRGRAKRRSGECLIELARPDSDWWFSFATDGAAETVCALLEHPDAREIEEIGRGLLPIDEGSVGLIRSLVEESGAVSLSEEARRAIDARESRGPQHEGGGVPAQVAQWESRFDIEFRRDRRGEHWILIAARGTALARVLAAQAGLRAQEGPAGTFGLAAVERDGEQLLELLDQIEDMSIDPRVSAWLRRATTWRGNIEVEGPREAPVFLLLGDAERLPRALQELASGAPGGATVPLTLDSWELIEAHLDGWLSEASRRCVSALRAGRPAPPAVLEISDVHDEATFVLAPGHDPDLLVSFAAINGTLQPRAGRSGARGHAGLPAIRVDPFCIPELDAFLVQGEVWVEEQALGMLQEMREQHARSAGLVELSAATDATLEVPGLGGELKPFQRAGVSYLLERRRAFLADEQGLGKTIEAIATLQAADAYPAIVVCPASLKLNWMRELERWLPGRTVQSLSGYGDGSDCELADVTVVNYDILGPRLEGLLAGRPQAVVIDEAHYCKNQGAKRTQAVQRLSAGVPRDGLVLALTGTPVVNRPAELISQLRILGRLEEFGSGAKFGARFRGADAHQRLHWHLRARCFVRRLKCDVLPQLPAKTRAVVPVELDNASEYTLAEHDLIAWLRSQPLDLGELDAKVAAALRAERLVRLNALKLLAARGKLTAALAWIHDFASSGERLVVFARHREVQRAVLERFPSALHILGADSPAVRDASLQAFQAPDGEDNQLIVCSMEVAGQGITLTRSSNVVFLELDWTPAKHDQAEDRCHRIGQQDAVNAYYLLAADTVDETIAGLLERKRAVIEAVTDGREEDEEGLLDALVRDLRGAPYRHLRAVA